jgi:KUP system potassium uptake protein
MKCPDGAITPAISVLSAIEGIKAPVPAIAPYVLPLAVVVLVGVFALQPQGSGRIGKLYGPIMALWFLAIGILGAYGILRHPGVFAALDPLYGLEYLFGHGWTGLIGSVPHQCCQSASAARERKKRLAAPTRPARSG